MLICIYVNCVTQVHKHVYRISIFWTHFFFLIEKNDCKAFQIQAYLICVCALLYCTLQIQCFIQTEDVWLPCIKQLYEHHFSNSVCSLHSSVSHLDNSCNILIPSPKKKKKKSSEGSDDSIFYFIIIFLSRQNSFKVFF